MSKFKKGDRVICISEGMQGLLTYNREYKVIQDADNYVHVVDDLGRKFGYYGHRFEHIKEENKMKFDMKTQPWFIRYNNEQEFNLVQEWLQENYGSNLQCAYIRCSDCLTNGDKELVYSHVMHGLSSTRSGYEIKLNFKTVVESVEWPEVESEAQKKIRELEETINSAQEQIQKLKGEIK